MATIADYNQLRDDLDLTEATLNNTKAQEVFDRAAAEYPNNAAAADKHARVIVLDQMLMTASKRNSYKRNQATENLKEIVDNLEKRRDEWIAKRDLANNTTAGGKARFGRTRRKPTKVREYPGGSSVW